MRLYYDGEKTKELTEKLLQKFSQEKQKRTTSFPIHVSDLINCEMKFYCRMKGLKESHTRKSIGMMVFGIIGQTIVQQLFPDEEREFETKLENLVFGHIDVYEDKKFPLEIKATRKRVYKKQNIPEKWIKQLMAYMSMENKKKGWLVFLNVFTNQLSAFAVEMTEQELYAYNMFLVGKAYKFRNVLENGNYDKLEILPEQYEFCEYKHECPRREECRREWRRLKWEKKKK